MMNKNFLALAMVVVLVAACMPAQVAAQTKADWTKFMMEWWMKNQFLQAAGLPTLNQDISAFTGGLSQWTGGLGNWGRKLLTE